MDVHHQNLSVINVDSFVGGLINGLLSAFDLLTLDALMTGDVDAGGVIQIHLGYLLLINGQTILNVSKEV